MASDVGVIDRFLNIFSAFIDSGFGLIEGDVFYLTSALIVISLTMAALFWAFDENGQVLVPFIRKVLMIGFFAYLLNDWQRLTETIAHSFTRIGLKAAGDPISVTDFFRPGAVAQKGMDVTDALLTQASSMGILNNFPEVFFITITALIVLFAFFIIALQILVTIIEFKLLTLATFVIVPFALFSKTTFLAERALGYIPSAGLKMMVLALIVAIGSTLYGELDPGTDPDIGEATAVCLGALVLMALSLYAPSLAGSLVSGGPSLGAGAAITTAAMAGGTAFTGAAVAGKTGWEGAKLTYGIGKAANDIRKAASLPREEGVSTFKHVTRAAGSVLFKKSAAQNPAPVAAGVSPASAAATSHSKGGAISQGVGKLEGLAKKGVSRGMGAVMSGDNSGGMTATNIGEKEE